MTTSARWAVANLPKITVKTLRSAGSMRRPQASFEAQPRIARLLAPKMGIGPYRLLAYCRSGWSDRGGFLYCGAKKFTGWKQIFA